MRDSIHGMSNSRNRIEAPVLASANDDLRTAGLRVLAKLIAQDLRVRKQRRVCLETEETFKAKEIDGENLS
jgi:hypothetical protein